jgi:hypothetical protein
MLLTLVSISSDHDLLSDVDTSYLDEDLRTPSPPLEIIHPQPNTSQQIILDEDSIIQDDINLDALLNTRSADNTEETLDPELADIAHKVDITTTINTTTTSMDQSLRKTRLLVRSIRHPQLPMTTQNARDIVAFEQPLWFVMYDVCYSCYILHLANPILLDGTI